MWRKKPGLVSDYELFNSDLKVIATARMTGIKGRWRWACYQFAKSDKGSGWSGYKNKLEDAQKAAEEYLRERGVVS